MVGKIEKMVLKDKTAIITGGSRGIGRAVALRLAIDGANIVLVYRNERDKANTVCERAIGLAKEKGIDIKAKPIKLDVSDFSASKTVVSEIAEEFGRIDILVNCAGITRDGLVAMMKESSFDDVMDTNLKGSFNMIRHCTPIFMKQRSGTIVNLASAVGITGNSGQVNYCASKAGIIGMTKSVAKELATRGIRCNAVAPGFIETDMTAALIELSGESKQGNYEKVRKLLDAIPMKRAGSAEEVAELVCFLASERSSYITGELIRVDGGLAM